MPPLSPASISGQRSQGHQISVRGRVRFPRKSGNQNHCWLPLRCSWPPAFSGRPLLSRLPLYRYNLLMTRRATPGSDWDSPWKEALRHFLERFLAFFFPDIHKAIDWKRGYEDLEKEFQQIVREAAAGKVFADKLFKVWLKDGAESWLLIHVEIQGEESVPSPTACLTTMFALGNCTAGRLSAWQCCAMIIRSGGRNASLMNPSAVS